MMSSTVMMYGKNKNGTFEGKLMNEIRRFTVTIKVDVFAKNTEEAKELGFHHLHEMMEEDRLWGLPFRIDAEVEEI